MPAELDLIFYYLRDNRNGFNALAGALESAGLKGLEVLIPDNEKDLFAAVSSSLEAGRKTAVGFSFFTSQAPEIAALLGRLRARYGREPVVLAGGPHPSGAPSEVLAAGADCVVKGEGERAVIRLVRAMLEAGDRPGGVVSEADPVDLDAFVPLSPRWHMFGSIEITRGCPFGCSYCQTSFLFGARQRHRGLDAVLAIARVLRAERLKHIRFLSPDAFAYGSPDGRSPAPDKIEALLRGTREAMGPGASLYFGSFPSEVRPEHVTPETLELTRRYADNKRLVIGAQSGSPRMLEAVRRGHTAEDVRRAVRLTREAGFGADVDFIFGLPGETGEDAELSLSLMEELVEMGARIHAHTFMPLPQTPLAGKPPAPLSAKAEKALRLFCSRGQAFGQWEKQQLAFRPRP